MSGRWDPSRACERVEVTGPDGARLVACAHGGHVLRWMPAPGAVPPEAVPDDGLLWLSPLACCGPGEAIRGGVPVIFPQFAGRGPLPKHGLARDRAWTLTSGDATTGARVSAVLVADTATRAVWPHAFTLTLDTAAAGAGLHQTLAVHNDGDAPFSFTAALHAYLALMDAGSATVHGVEGAAAEDNAGGGAPITMPSRPFPALGPRDVAVRHLGGPVSVVERLDGGELRRVTVDPVGFEDVVIWNPGAAHGLADVPPGGAASFVCVEPAQLDPVTLVPGASWTASWTLTVQVETALVPLRRD